MKIFHFLVDLTKILIIRSPIASDITLETLTLRIALYPSYRNVLSYFQILVGWMGVFDVGAAGISVERSFRMVT